MLLHIGLYLFIILLFCKNDALWIELKDIRSHMRAQDDLIADLQRTNGAQQRAIDALRRTTEQQQSAIGALRYENGALWEENDQLREKIEKMGRLFDDNNRIQGQGTCTLYEILGTVVCTSYLEHHLHK